YDYDLSNASIVTMFLLPDSIEELKGNLITQLNPGTKIVSFKFPIHGWKAELIDKESKIFIYQIE
ncbi:MAG: SAM-dependent methyltransferase, partial [Cyanobacteria bacterium J06621_12]